MVRVAVSGACAFVVSVVLTELCKHVARRVGMVAVPRADRWHRQSIPLLGGVAIGVALLAVVPFAVTVTPLLAALFGGAFALFVLGLVDDRVTLRPHTKLIAQIVVAAALAALGLQLRLTPFAALNVALTLFWIVGITNAFNLLDNMDGLAAGVAVITGAFRLGFFLIDGNMEGATVAAIFVGAVLGFLVHNFSPASIFMGDAGSLLIGVFIAGLSLSGGYPYSRGVLSVVLFPVLVLLVPIFDTAFVTLSRVLARRPVSEGGRDHTSHRLVALGLTERHAVMWLYGVACASGTIAAFTYWLGFSYAVVVIAFLGLGIVILGMFLGRIRVYPDDVRPAGDATLPARLLTAVSSRRRVVTVLVDVGLMVLAYYSAYLLRFEDSFERYRGLIVASLPIVLACQVAAFGFFRVHAGIWRYTGLKDLVRVTQAASAGTVATVIVLVYVYRFDGYSRAVFVIDWLLLIVFVTAARLSFRVLAEYLRPETTRSRRVLLYGAGEGGMLVLREMRINPALGRSIVGFVDDDPSKQQRSVQGVPVLGGCDEVAGIIRKYHVEELVIASVKIPADRVRQVVEVCEGCGVTTARAELRLG